MNLVDILTVCAFIGVLLLGIMLLVAQDMRNTRPSARIRARMQDAFSFDGQRAADGPRNDNSLLRVDVNDNAFGRWFGPKLARLRTVAGAAGLRIALIAGFVSAVAAVLAVEFLPVPGFTKPLILLGLPVFAVARAYRYLVERFRRRFLDGFPDLIDLIVRAVRAGVPVTHVIGTAAEECPEPLRQEFKSMSDSLQVGLDLEEVLSVAVKRIEIADFSFFCVCLLLQRETGGQLGETLENLSNIVRTRREIRHKTKALTAESRITTKILAAIPLVIMSLMYVLNKEYLIVLFTTESGQRLLTFGAISVAIGVALINKMAKLDTSR